MNGRLGNLQHLYLSFPSQYRASTPLSFFFFLLFIPPFYLYSSSLPLLFLVLSLFSEYAYSLG